MGPSPATPRTAAAKAKQLRARAKREAALQDRRTVAAPTTNDTNSANVSTNDDAGGGGGGSNNRSPGGGSGGGDKARASGQLTRQEDRMTGTVKGRIWFTYARALGFLWIVALLVIYMSAQGAKSFGDWSLAQWTHTLSDDDGGRGSSSSGVAGLDPHLVVYGAALLLSVLLILLRALVLTAANVRAATRVHNNALWAVLRADMAFFDTTPSGRVLNRFSNDMQKVDMQLRNQMASLLNQSMAMVAGVVMILLTSPYVAAIIPLLLVFYHRLQETYRSTSREVRRLQAISRSPIFHHFGEVLDGLATVRAFRRQAAMATHAAGMLDNFCRCVRTGTTANKWLAVRLDLLGSLVVLAVGLSAAAEAVTTGSAPSAALLGLSLTYAFQVTGFLNGFMTSFASAEVGLVAMERLQQFADLPSEAPLVLPLPPPPAPAASSSPLAGGGPVSPPGARRFWAGAGAGAGTGMPRKSRDGYTVLPADADIEDGLANRLPNGSLNGSPNGHVGADRTGKLDQQAAFDPPATWPQAGQVEFRNVVMRYRPGLEPVLRGVNVTIGAGMRVGVVGRTGSGKSSLLVALFRLVELNRTTVDRAVGVEPPWTMDQGGRSSSVGGGGGGAIWIDGVDIASVGLHTLRQRLSIIPQDPVLFGGTLRRNLDPFHEFDDMALANSLDAVGLRGLVEERGAGLDMKIEPRGENLSVGQRQLVCIARGLLRRARVVVLDEATASIDTETDKLIQRLLREELRGATVLTIAHRLDTVVASDAILVMHDGKAAEFGPAAQLLADPESRFSALWAEHHHGDSVGGAAALSQ